MPSGITSGDLIKSSLRLTCGIATGETPTADEMTDGRTCLNDLLEIMSTQNLAMFGSADFSANTVANQAAYTIGPTGQWITDRPVRINDSPFCTVGGVDFPIELIGQEDYDTIGLKTQTGQIVERMLFINDNPNGRLTLWPVPTAVIPITMNIDRVLTQVPDLVTVMNFPPGYLLYMKIALGIMMAPDYGRVVSDDIKEQGRTAFANIKRANKVRRTASYDAMLVSDEPVTYQRGY